MAWIKKQLRALIVWAMTPDTPAPDVAAGLDKLARDTKERTGGG